MKNNNKTLQHHSPELRGHIREVFDELRHPREQQLDAALALIMEADAAVHKAVETIAVAQVPVPKFDIDFRDPQSEQRLFEMRAREEASRAHDVVAEIPESAEVIELRRRVNMGEAA